MLQIHTYNYRNLKRPYDYQDTIMPAADKAERLISTCLNQDGSSGYLRPDAPMCILE